jgi:sugar O-acyltransferase (sialic acid O-acetyltransferase NeuD family)
LENIVIIGSSGHAKVVIDIVQREGLYNIVGLIDSFRAVDETTWGYRVLGGEHDLPALTEQHRITGATVAIGDNFVRATVAARIRDTCPDIELVRAIHPSAVVADSASIGAGSVIMAGAVIAPCSTIGQGCIINTGATLDHDSAMGDFASLAPGAVTGGNCRIGECSAISIGATLIHGLTIGEHSVIGAGSLVMDSIGPLVVAYGVPAKVVRSRGKGGKYLTRQTLADKHPCDNLVTVRRDGEGRWYDQYSAGEINENGALMCWRNGATSKTARGAKTAWPHVKPYEDA